MKHNKKNVLTEIEAAFNLLAMPNPLLSLQKVCECLDMPHEIGRIIIPRSHLFTPDYCNDFFKYYRDVGRPCNFQMTDYEGFKILVKYAQATGRIKQTKKGKANEND